MDFTTAVPQNPINQPSLFGGSSDTGDGAARRPSTGAEAAPLSSPMAIGQSNRVGHSKSEKAWLCEVSNWQHLFVLRQFLREYWEARNMWHLAGNCAQSASLWKNLSTGETQLRPHSCSDRSRCPTCSIKYGRERGLEVQSLFTELLTPRDGWLRDVPTVKAFAVVFTCPDDISAYVDGFIERRDKKGLGLCLRQLTEAVSSSLAWVFADVYGAKISWHWWHSSDPTKGPHLHAHVMVPNIAVSNGTWAGVLRERGMLPPAALEALKKVWGDNVASRPFVKTHGRFKRAEVVDWGFLTNLTGRHSIAHRSRYDYRSPMADFSRETLKNGLPESDAPGLAWFLDRCEFLQGVQLVRSVGWLNNTKLHRLGYELFDPPSDDWVKLTGWYVFERFDEGGVHVSYWKNGDKCSGYFPRHRVNLEPSPRARVYRWSFSGAPPQPVAALAA